MQGFQGLKILSAHEERLLIQAAVSKRDKAIMLLLLNTGLRLKELCNLKWRDYHRQSSELSYLQIDDRQVPLNTDAMDALRDLGAENAELAEAEHILKGERGQKQVAVRTVQHMIQKYAAKGGLDRVTAMALRHTFSKRIANTPDFKQYLNLISALTGRTNASSVQYQSTQNLQINQLNIAVKNIRR